MPCNWLLDFDHVTLRFDTAKYAATARLEDRRFHINIDLNQIHDFTIKQLKTSPEKEIKPNEFAFQFVGNVTYNIVQAFFRYNKQNHPDYVEGKTSEDITNEFLRAMAEQTRKDYNASKLYIS